MPSPRMAFSTQIPPILPTLGPLRCILLGLELQVSGVAGERHRAPRLCEQLTAPPTQQRTASGPSTSALESFATKTVARQTTWEKLMSSTHSSSAGSRFSTSLTSSYLACSFRAWWCWPTSCRRRLVARNALSLSTSCSPRLSSCS